MARVGPVILPPLHRRMCLTCGYAGIELQLSEDTAPWYCPGCGQDLYARPARSYAELEGIDKAPSGQVAPGAEMECERNECAPCEPSPMIPLVPIRSHRHRIASVVVAAGLLVALGVALGWML